MDERAEEPEGPSGLFDDAGTATPAGGDRSRELLQLLMSALHGHVRMLGVTEDPAGGAELELELQEGGDKYLVRVARA